MRRVRTVGCCLVGGGSFSDCRTSRDKVIASVLRDSVGHCGQWWVLSPHVRRYIANYLHNVKVVHHRHNGRFQYFSVYVPGDLLFYLRSAYEDDRLFKLYQGVF